MEEVINSHSYLSTLSAEKKKLLSNMGTRSERFIQWFLDNQTKIISKLRGARQEEELQVTFTLK